MDASVRRKGTIGTVTEATGWMRRQPILVGAFFLHALFGIVLEQLDPVGDTLAFVLLFLNGLVHVLGARDVAGEVWRADRDGDR